MQMSLGLLLPSSNCVINLAPDKRAVLREAYRVLKVGSGAGLGPFWGPLLHFPARFAPLHPAHSSLPSSPAERCTSAMSTPASA